MGYWETLGDRDINRHGAIIEQDLDLTDMLHIQEPASRNRSYRNGLISSHHWGRGGRGDSWSGYVTPETLADVCNVYEPGPGAAKLRELLTDSVDLRKTSRRRRTRENREEGEAIGDPFEYTLWRKGATKNRDWWEQTETVEHRKHGIVDIHCDIGITAGQAESHLEMSGACALALTDMLESIGYRVNLWATVSVQHENVLLDQRILVKGADERLSTAAMALICKGGVARTAMTCNWDANEKVQIGWGYGRPRRYSGRFKADVVVPFEVWNEASAVKFVREQMEKFMKIEDGDDDE